jgi:lysophospholipase L1-like esterase
MRWSLPSRSRQLALAALGLATILNAAPAQEPKKPAESESTTDPVARSSQGWWMERHAKKLEEMQPGKADLIFIGDSIIQGWEGNGREVWERYYAPRKAVNLGYSGDRTQHVLWRLDHDEVRGINPKVAVVMIGTNNIASNSPDEIALGITAIVRKLRDKLPKTKILLLGVFPRSPKPDATRDRIRAINDQIKSLTSERDVTFLDISKTFLNPDGTIPQPIMPDFLHLSPKGYRMWAEAIEPTLWEMMEGK